MDPRASKRGFTLYELQIAVLAIAILAAMSWTAFQRINTRSRGSAFWNDCRVFSEAFYRYAQEKGTFPPDQTTRNTVPPNMTGYLNTTNWLRITPLGGDYEWDDISAANSFGTPFRGAIRVNGATLKLAQLQQIDAWFDDGNMSTGNMRITDGGATVIFIVER